MSNGSGTMKAVVFDGPYKVSVQDRPIPKVAHERDIVIKVQATALCGSDLHIYRGLEPTDPGPIMGHEFVGHVIEAGAGVQTVAVGDKIVCPFTVSCGQCWYCRQGDTARCVESACFGSPNLNGGQAEYVRIPHADGTVMKAPSSVPENALILMADILPTGFYGVKSALAMAQGADVSQSTMVIIGAGPVGCCAALSALHFKPKHLFVVDSVDSRLDIARKLGAEPLNFQKDPAGMKARVMEVTEGRGADMVVEVVGLSPALRTAFDLVRPFGVISSIGVHNAEIPWSATEGYDKNLRFQMGRCPVRKVFAEALDILERYHEKLNFMFDKIMPLSDAVEAYDLFDKRQVQKVVFTV
ncbi:Zn-dependent alcohol dehydrogenase [Emericellopsis cladophorae]|uniref:Zn-dependent alcohol dehydrogenase n=1 Tax=Emericellopsis cladophorae TaxID=2686198 RepID=A0A9P9XX72_9HYPO|nr:Zn-dependent alcohol dehydrogenase [Emericellopsis cladophorae]KAI6779503.1 Zn-dependent alcohol dehydrogenase [Emericellopsis cladophorae]